MKVTKFPIIPITISFVFGIILNHSLHGTRIQAILLCSCCLAIVALAHYFAKKDFIQKSYFGISALLTSLAIGALTHSLHTDKNYEKHYSHFTTDGNNKIIGTISERLKPNAYSEKYYLKIQSLNNQEVFGKILVHAAKKEFPQPFQAGQQLLLHEELQAVPKTLNPYQFDYAAYLEKQQVYHQLYLKRDNFRIASQQSNLDYYVERYQDKLLNSFNIHKYSEVTDNIIKALLLGQRQDMNAEINQQYTDAGVIHILAISGLHIAMLYAMLLFFLKPLNRLKKGKLIQLLVALGFLWSFAVLAGLSASVVRSVVMFSFMSLGLYWNKSANMYNTMAVSMLLMLLVKPNFLFDVGFQLSYAAVFAIVWLQPLFRKYRFKNNPIINYGLDLVLISLIAQIGVLPISLYYFHQFPSLFLLANLVVIPLSSFILVYGIFILVLNFVCPSAAVIAGKLLSLSIELMNGYIAWIASFEGFTLKEIPFSFPLLLSLYLLIVTIVLYAYQRNCARLYSILISGFVFQLTLLFSFSEHNNAEEFIVFNNKRTTLVLHKKKTGIVAYTNDSLRQDNPNLKAYKRGNFNQQLEIRALQNVAYYKYNSILIIDSLSIYKLPEQPEIVVLTQSPKLNLERLLAETRPKQIVADGSNYKSYVKRWKATCEKAKIPFHATAEKGFYKLN